MYINVTNFWTDAETRLTSPNVFHQNKIRRVFTIPHNRIALHSQINMCLKTPISHRFCTAFCFESARFTASTPSSWHTFAQRNPPGRDGRMSWQVSSSHGMTEKCVVSCTSANPWGKNGTYTLDKKRLLPNYKTCWTNLSRTEVI